MDESHWLVILTSCHKLAVQKRFAAQAPLWQESDTCELCGKPFFWNVQKSSTQVCATARCTQ